MPIGCVDEKRCRSLEQNKAPLLRAVEVREGFSDQIWASERRGENTRCHPRKGSYACKAVWGRHVVQYAVGAPCKLVEWMNEEDSVAHTFQEQDGQGHLFYQYKNNMLSNKYEWIVWSPHQFPNAAINATLDRVHALLNTTGPCTYMCSSALCHVHLGSSSDPFLGLGCGSGRSASRSKQHVASWWSSASIAVLSDRCFKSHSALFWLTGPKLSFVQVMLLAQVQESGVVGIYHQIINKLPNDHVGSYILPLSILLWERDWNWSLEMMDHRDVFQLTLVQLWITDPRPARPPPTKWNKIVV